MLLLFFLHTKPLNYKYFGKMFTWWYCWVFNSMVSSLEITFDAMTLGQFSLDPYSLSLTGALVVEIVLLKSCYISTSQLNYWFYEFQHFLTQNESIDLGLFTWKRTLAYRRLALFVGFLVRIRDDSSWSFRISALIWTKTKVSLNIGADFPWSFLIHEPFLIHLWNFNLLRWP